MSGPSYMHAIIPKCTQNSNLSILDQIKSTDIYSMATIATKVAVVGCGISGAVCASQLAKAGVSVTVFELGRGPGGRMSHRRETSEDGRELSFDHGAPYFTVNNPDVMSLVHDWESRGLVAEWKEKFGVFDCLSKKFQDNEKEGLLKKYVGVPGMNSICKALCDESGVQHRFGNGVGKLEWLEDDDLWSLIGVNGELLGRFKGVASTDRLTFIPRVTSASGEAPIDMNVAPEMALKVKELPVTPRFALMLAFEEPLASIPVKGFSFKNSEVLSWAYCESSKPGRSAACERWVLHSTAKYAENIIAQTGHQKLSGDTLTKIAEELTREFESTVPVNSRPFFKRAHRWGSAFPSTSVAEEEKCLWDGKKRLAVCGDFCVSPNVEGAVASGMAAALKFTEICSSL